MKPTYSNRDTEARRGQKSFEGRVGQCSWNSNGYGEKGQLLSPEGEAVLSEGHTRTQDRWQRRGKATAQLHIRVPSAKHPRYQSLQMASGGTALAVQWRGLGVFIARGWDGSRTKTLQNGTWTLQGSCCEVYV